MKYNVIRRFRDKYTGEIYLPGDAFVSDETWAKIRVLKIQEQEMEWS